MAHYVDSEKLRELCKYRDHMFEIRRKTEIEFGIDLLDNDALSSLCIWEVVSQYDPHL